MLTFKTGPFHTFLSRISGLSHSMDALLVVHFHCLLVLGFHGFSVYKTRSSFASLVPFVRLVSLHRCHRCKSPTSSSSQAQLVGFGMFWREANKHFLKAHVSRSSKYFAPKQLLRAKDNVDKQIVATGI